ncbi:MAG: hypothetical protein KUA37_13455 [Desulfomicrobium sp.]|nr:hypothetical protein [Pseudomonadota bacterium]MBV1712991.1 hypothetical protein [Desulfomicrobium sp.]MBU4571961.1 hypothetical protein [Pseudomonadota bacterium]MBU4596110.1 hypothetical protein [Pseudomonadota bacterium]MBV1721414.1 hypothetical protein [Desulfomicrobium sp.]
MQDYVAVNWQIVHDVAERHAEVFAEYMREVELWLHNGSGNAVQGKRRDEKDSGAGAS